MAPLIDEQPPPPPLQRPPLVRERDRLRAGPRARIRRLRRAERRRAGNGRLVDDAWPSRALDDPRRVRSRRVGAVRVRCRHPHADPDADVGVAQPVRRTRRTPDGGAVGAVRCPTVGRAAQPAVRERHRRRAGPRSSVRRERTALDRLADDAGLGGVVRWYERHRRAGARQERRCQSGRGDDRQSDTKKQSPTP